MSAVAAAMMMSAACVARAVGVQQHHLPHQQQCGVAAIPPTLNATKDTGGAGGVRVQVERTDQVIFNVSEAIHGAHGLGFALHHGSGWGELQVTVGVNFKNSLVTHWVPECGVPATKPLFQCFQSRAKRSTDRGRTWRMMPVNDTTNRSVSEFSNYAFQYEDTGEVIQFTGVQVGSVRRVNASTSVVMMEMIRSFDSANSQNTTWATVTAPTGLLAEGWLSTSHSSIVQLGDGALLANVYAAWKGVDGYNAPAKRSKTRVCVIHSDDRGANWRYVATVAWDPINATTAEDRSSNCEVNGMGNGFDEASLVVIPAPTVGFGRAGQTIVCIMRSGGPLYRAFSLDSGGSWSVPQVIAPHGVSPQAIIMRPSGIMAIAYGRPYNWLRFSLDGGRTFLPEICYDRPPMEPYDGGEYSSVMQIPGTEQLLLTYARCTDNPFDMEILGLTLTVTRLDTPAKPLLKTDDSTAPEISDAGNLSMLPLRSKLALKSDEISRPLNVVQEQVIFHHGDGGMQCVRSPNLLLAGKRLIAMTEVWNYTGNNCELPGIPPLNHSYILSGYQRFLLRTSDSNGRTWSKPRFLPLKQLCWNAQMVYFQGKVIVIVAVKATGHLLSLTSEDGGGSFGPPVDISHYFPARLIAAGPPWHGMKPAYGSGIVVPHQTTGRILMTTYSSCCCHVLTSTDGVAWEIASTVPQAFECSLAWLGSHNVYLNARHGKQNHIVANASRVTRVGARSTHDGFDFIRNASLSTTFDPDSGGVRGDTTSIATIEGSRMLLFAIAAGPIPYPASYKDVKGSHGRQNLALHQSTDGGVSWTFQLLRSGYAGYVSLAPLPLRENRSEHSLGELGVLVEVGATGCEGACALAFISANLSSSSSAA